MAKETVHYSMRLDADVHADAERAAKAERRSLANWIKGLIEGRLEQNRVHDEAAKRGARR